MAVPVTTSQIAHLIFQKQTEIKNIRDQLAQREIELKLFEELHRRFSDIQPDIAWNDFLDWLDSRAPELSDFLNRIQMSSLTAGKLALFASEINKEMLLLYRGPIEAMLAQYFEMNYTLEIVDDRTAEESGAANHPRLVSSVGDNSDVDFISERQAIVKGRD